MPSLRLVRGSRVLDLDGYLKHEKGVQVMRGLTGLGLPPVQVQWFEGAGDGASYRGRRVTSRTIDLPLYINGKNHAGLAKELDNLSRVLDGEATLYFKDDSGNEWYTNVVRTGGGQYTYGSDTTGENGDIILWITLEAGDPYWTSTNVSRKTVKAGSGAPFLGSLANLSLSASQVIGDFVIENPGTADAYPVWVVRGPGTIFRATSPRGETIAWNGTLAAGESLTIDTRLGTVVDSSGENRYAEMGSAPTFWSVPPGTTTAHATLSGTTTASSISVEWKPRKWMVV